MERIEREPVDSPLLQALRRPAARDGPRARRRNPPAGAAGRDPELGPQSDLRADLGAAAARHAAGVCGRSAGARGAARRCPSGWRRSPNTRRCRRSRPMPPSIRRTRFLSIIEGPAAFEAEPLAHPLLPAPMAVANDVRLGGSASAPAARQRLEHVGQEHVAADGRPQRGARAGGCAGARTAVAMTPLRDRRDAADSGFAAGRAARGFSPRSRRISEIVALTRSTSAPCRLRRRTGVLFLLDELLAGTNSHDRLQGATGILVGPRRARRDRPGDDTRPGADRRSPTTLAASAANVHFEDRFEDGVLTFDYRLKPGVVRSSNAMALMRAVGSGRLILITHSVTVRRSSLRGRSARLESRGRLPSNGFREARALLPGSARRCRDRCSHRRAGALRRRGPGDARRDPRA